MSSSKQEKILITENSKFLGISISVINVYW